MVIRGTMLKYLRFLFLLVIPGFLLEAAPVGDLQTPRPISPIGPSSHWPQFKWTAVPRAEFYVLRLWVEDNLGCPGRDETSITGETHNPHTSFYSATDMCNMTMCGVDIAPSNHLKSPFTGRYEGHYPSPQTAARAAAIRDGGGSDPYSFNPPHPSPHSHMPADLTGKLTTADSMFGSGRYRQLRD